MLSDGLEDTRKEPTRHKINVCIYQRKAKILMIQKTEYKYLLAIGQKPATHWRTTIKTTKAIGTRKIIVQSLYKEPRLRSLVAPIKKKCIMNVNISKKKT